MNPAVVIGCPGAAGEEGGRELRRGFCSPGLPLATHNIHRAASEFVGSKRALPSPVSFVRTAIKFRQEPSSRCAEIFHFQLPAFAGSSGLVAAPYGQRGSKRKIKDVRKAFGVLGNV